MAISTGGWIAIGVGVTAVLGLTIYAVSNAAAVQTQMIGSNVVQPPIQQAPSTETAVVQGITTLASGIIGVIGQDRRDEAALRLARENNAYRSGGMGGSAYDPSNQWGSGQSFDTRNYLPSR